VLVERGINVAEMVVERRIGPPGFFDGLVGLGAAVGAFLGPFLASSLSFVIMFVIAAVVFLVAFITLKLSPKNSK